MPVPPDDPQRTRLIAQAIALCSRWKSLSEDEAQKTQISDRLQQLWQELATFNHPLQTEAIAIEEIPLQVRYCFVQAVCFSSRYSQLGGSCLSGTLNSPTLATYVCDPIPLQWHQSAIVEQLCEHFQLSAIDTIAIENQLNKIDGAIEQQKAIIQALVAEFGGIDNRQQALELFSALFGIKVLPETAIDCLATPMQLVFAIDYEQQRLRDKTLWSSLAQSDRDILAQFLIKINRFNFTQFECFPSFGYLEAVNIPDQLSNKLIEATGYSKPVIVQAIARSVSLVPTSKSEAFLIHDIWGHFWQLFLTQFDSDYAIMSTAHKDLNPGLAAYTEQGVINLRELFILEGNQVKLEEKKARLFFHGEVQQRLGHLFTHLVGEMLADISEFKWLWQNNPTSDNLPSSSLFKNLPTKIDLSLIDLDFLFLQVLEPLLSYKMSVVEDSLLEQELIAEWSNHTLQLRLSLKRAVVKMYSIFLEEYSQCYQPNIKLADGIFGDLLTNLVYLQNILNQLYTLPIQQKNLPYQDLILLFVGCYCSADCYQDFWDLDDVLAEYFLPCWLNLNKFKATC